MANSVKNTMKEVMTLAWQFVKKNGFSMREALVIAWRNIKLKARMMKGIVKFYFVKVDGSLREAYGTLRSDLMAETRGEGRRANDTCQTYFDTEKAEYRCFKKANLARI